MNNLSNWLRLKQAQRFMARRKKECPVLYRQAVAVADDGSDILTRWFYTHLVNCPDSGGYTCLRIIDDKLYAYSLCESDHPGPGPEDCLYIDGIPLDRNELRPVPEGAVITVLRKSGGYLRPIQLAPWF